MRRFSKRVGRGNLNKPMMCDINIEKHRKTREIPLKIQELLSEGNERIAVPGKELVREIVDVLRDLAEEFRDAATGTMSVPSAPDTSKFRATRYGMIEFVKNVTIHGSYGISNTYQYFLKIGSAVDTRVRDEIFDEFKQSVESIGITIRDDYTHIESSDGWRVSIAFTYGSAWGGIGLRYV